MSNDLITRDYTLVIGNTVNLTGIGTNPITGVLSFDAGVVVKDLNMKFSIQRNRDSSKKAASASVEVWNLSDTILNSFQDIRFVNISLYAGYAGTSQKTVDLLLQGNVIDISTKKTGSDKVTTFTIGPDYVPLHRTKVTSYIPGGQTIQDVIESIRQQMDAYSISEGGGHIAKGIYEGDNIQTKLLYGYPVSGTAKQKLDEICMAYRLEYDLTNGKLNIRDENSVRTSADTTRTYVMSKDTGLLEIPYFYMDSISQKLTTPVSVIGKDGKAHMTKVQKVKHYGVKFKALLNPYLRPGDLVLFQGGLENTQGYYMVSDIHYYGEYRGNDWCIECNCDKVQLV